MDNAQNHIDKIDVIYHSALSKSLLHCDNENSVNIIMSRINMMSDMSKVIDYKNIELRIAFWSMAFAASVVIGLLIGSLFSGFLSPEVYSVNYDHIGSMFILSNI